MSKEKGVLFPKTRRHTYYYLQHSAQFKAVYLDMEIDMTNVRAERKRLLEEQGEKISYIAFLIQAISQVIQNYPEANSAVEHSWLPKLALYDEINAKFTMDKELDGTRVVLAGMVPNSDRLSLPEIQEIISTYRDRPFEEFKEYKAIRQLQALPLGIGQKIYNLVLRNLKNRSTIQGTFSVTSLGHRPINSFHPIISSTLCFGVGGIEEKPVVIDGEIQVRARMPLSLGFDHRAIDGAMAADLLTDVKTLLECWGDAVWQDDREKVNMM